MRIEYDKNKSEKNNVERNLSFDQVIDFEWETAILIEDTRKSYPEQRFLASGFLNDRLHVLCFTKISGGIRVISFRKANRERLTDMKKRKPLTNKKGEVRELTKADFMAMRPMEEVLPPDLVATIKKRKRGERGAQKKPTKISLTVRYSPEVVKYFKSTGEGWQVRMDKVLKSYVKKHHAA